MIQFITTLEDILTNSGRDDWEIIYHPKLKGYILKIDEVAVFLMRVDTAEGENDE